MPTRARRQARACAHSTHTRAHTPARTQDGGQRTHIRWRKVCTQHAQRWRTARTQERAKSTRTARTQEGGQSIGNSTSKSTSKSISSAGAQPQPHKHSHTAHSGGLRHTVIASGTRVVSNRLVASGTRVVSEQTSGLMHTPVVSWTHWRLRHTRDTLVQYWWAHTQYCILVGTHSILYTVGHTLNTVYWCAYTQYWWAHTQYWWAHTQHLCTHTHVHTLMYNTHVHTLMYTHSHVHTGGQRNKQQV